MSDIRTETQARGLPWWAVAGMVLLAKRHSPDPGAS